MKTAALYDIHGNVPALEAVLEEIRREGVEQIVIGGDVVPGPLPNEAIEILLNVDRPVKSIHGNGESWVLAAIAGKAQTMPEQAKETVQWTASQLRPEYTTFLESWPSTLCVTIPPYGNVLFCHATPRSELELFTKLTSESKLRPIFDSVEEEIIVCGHTHMQFDRMVGSKRIINAGSVGMPFGTPGAYWLLFGDEIELRHTSYNLAEAAARIQQSAHPQAKQFARDNVLTCPSEEQMLKAFSAKELQ